MYFIKKFKKNFLHRLWNIICCDNPYKWFSYFCIVHAVGGQDMKQILLFDIIAFPETEIVWASTTYVEYKYKLFCQALTVLTPKFKFNIFLIKKTECTNVGTKYFPDSRIVLVDNQSIKSQNYFKTLAMFTGTSVHLDLY